MLTPVAMALGLRNSQRPIQRRDVRLQIIDPFQIADADPVARSDGGERIPAGHFMFRRLLGRRFRLGDGSDGGGFPRRHLQALPHPHAVFFSLFRSRSAAMVVP